MEILLNIVTGFVADATRGHVATAFDWLAKWLHDFWQPKKDESIQELLESIGCNSDHDIQALVQKHTADLHVTQEQREELTNLLINLAHSARFLTTQALSRSTALRTRKMLGDILEGLRTKRKAGEKVQPGSAWVLEKFLGKGAFGEVWLGGNPGFPRKRAFKFFTDLDTQEWVRREQQALYHVKARLGDHPNIVTFEDVALDVEPWPYLSLEYVAGGNLENWIVSHPEDRLPLAKGRIIEDIARALAEAHGQHIYHRDLKPANILLTDDPKDVQAKVGDFGLGRVEARAPGAGSFSAHLSQALVGTPLYLPPEASLPFHDRHPARDDVFALGVIWYQLLVEQLERPPYDFADRLRERAVDSHTIRLIARCLAQPRRRFADAAELYQAMGGIPEADWQPPEGCYDVQYLVREYLAARLV